MKPPRTGLGNLIRFFAFGALALAVLVAGIGLRSSLEIAAKRPEDSYAVGAPFVDGAIWAIGIFLVSLLLFVFARVADKSAAA